MARAKRMTIGARVRLLPNCTEIGIRQEYIGNVCTISEIGYDPIFGNFELKDPSLSRGEWAVELENIELLESVECPEQQIIYFLDKYKEDIC